MQSRSTSGLFGGGTEESVCVCVFAATLDSLFSAIVCCQLSPAALFTPFPRLAVKSFSSSVFADDSANVLSSWSTFLTIIGCIGLDCCCCCLFMVAAPAHTVQTPGSG